MNSLSSRSFQFRRSLCIIYRCVKRQWKVARLRYVFAERRLERAYYSSQRLAATFRFQAFNAVAAALFFVSTGVSVFFVAFADTDEDGGSSYSSAPTTGYNRNQTPLVDWSWVLLTAGILCIISLVAVRLLTRKGRKNTRAIVAGGICLQQTAILMLFASASAVSYEQNYARTTEMWRSIVDVLTLEGISSIPHFVTLIAAGMGIGHLKVVIVSAFSMMLSPGVAFVITYVSIMTKHTSIGSSSTAEVFMNKHVSETTSNAISDNQYPNFQMTIARGIVTTIVAFYLSVLEEYTSRLAFVYLPVPSVPPVNEMEPTNMSQTTIERIIDKLTGLRMRYCHNTELSEVLQFALDRFDEGVESLYRLDLSTVLMGDGSMAKDRYSVRSGLRKYLDWINGVPSTRNLPRAPNAQIEGSLLSSSGVYRNSRLLGLTENNQNCVGTWSFDVFQLTENGKANPLSTVLMYINRRYDLTGLLQLDRKRFFGFISKIESLYYENVPYHNSLHAADVTNSMLYFIVANGWCDCMRTIDFVALIIAAACHDVGHPGRANTYLTNSRHPLAIRYNDQSILENYHAATAFEIMERPETSALHSLTREEFKAARSIIVSTILETDMKKHFEFITNFRGHFSRYVRNETTESSPVLRHVLLSECLEDEASKSLIYRMLMKCSDLGHAAKKVDVHARWSLAITEEFHLQGIVEQAENLPISPLCDRKGADFEKNQEDFITVVCLPLFGALVDTCRCPALEDDVLRQAKENRAHWQWLSLTKTPVKKQKKNFSVDARRKIRTKTVCDTVDTDAFNEFELSEYSCASSEQSDRGDAASTLRNKSLHVMNPELFNGGRRKVRSRSATGSCATIMQHRKRH